MTKEYKELLLKDLCCRLPYGVKASTKVGGNIKISSVEYDTIFGEDGDSYDVSFITPYLFPMSSMTDEQKEVYHSICNMNGWDMSFREAQELIDWLNANHFDYRGLIEKGLAIDATNLGIYGNKQHSNIK